MDFHHQLKGAVLDEVDEGLIPHDPTRKVIIKEKILRTRQYDYDAENLFVHYRGRKYDEFGFSLSF